MERKMGGRTKNTTSVDFDEIVEQEPSTENIVEVSSSELDILFEDENYQKISPGKWDEFVEVIDILSKDSDDMIIINDSVITHKFKGNAILKADLNKIFSDNKINLQITTPKKWIKLFKSFKKMAPVYIVDEENRFIITDGSIKLYLPKCMDSILDGVVYPDISNVEVIEKCIINKETRDTVWKLMGSLAYIEYLFQDDHLKAVNIPDLALFILPEYVTDVNVKKISNINASLVLRTSAFLPYPSDVYTLIIGKDNGKYFSQSLYRTALTTIEIYEVLDDSTDIESLY